MIYQSPNIDVKLLDNHIAHLRFNAQSSVNKFDRATLVALDNALNAIIATAGIRGLLLSSAKDSFVVGADITEFLTLFARPADELQSWLHMANAIFNKLEDLPFPTLSAVNGYALGGGCEVILATDFRIADASARVGLPETKLGLIPGFGGTVRLPRLIGADNALEWITTGKEYRPEQALAQGFFDAIVTPEQLVSAGLQMLTLAIADQLPWLSKRHQKQHPLLLDNTEAAMVFSVAKGMVYAVAGKHYPAPNAAVTLLEQAAAHTRDLALQAEHQVFIKLAKTDIATALIGIFLNEQQVKSKAKKLTNSASSTAKAAVLGAGIMGGGIAYQCASKGLPVVMKDINDKALHLGLDEAANLLNAQVSKGKITSEKMAKVLNRIVPTLEYSVLKDADVAIEAVVENPQVKGKVLQEVEQQLTPQAVIASNTSTISIDLLASKLQHPQRFCGMHFFNPVHKMPLVEVIRGKETSTETIATVVALATAMGKTPVVVNDCPGFFVNRVLFPYFAGFNQLLADGADFQHIDRVMEKQFGWPMGPAYLLDVVGLDTANHAQQVMADGFPQRMAKPTKDSIAFLFAQQRLGQKSGQGFYQYARDKTGKLKKGDASQGQALLAEYFGATKLFSDEEIIARTMIPMINEAIRCLEEGIIASPAEADIALLYGLGFPPFRGGVFRYVDTLGTDNYLRWAENYAHLGPLYAVTPQLSALAATRGHYFPTHSA